MIDKNIVSFITRVCVYFIVNADHMLVACLSFVNNTWCMFIAVSTAFLNIYE